MSFAKHFNRFFAVSAPPPGAVNVLVGNAVEGPGGRWVPCASAISDGIYLSCVFEVGPGRRQVCANNRRARSADEALVRAIELATTAAA